MHVPIEMHLAFSNLRRGIFMKKKMDGFHGSRLFLYVINQWLLRK